MQKHILKRHCNLDHYTESVQKRATFTGLDLDLYDYYFRVWNNINGGTANLSQAHLTGTFPQDGNARRGCLRQMPMVATVQ